VQRSNSFHPSLQHSSVAIAFDNITDLFKASSVEDTLDYVSIRRVVGNVPYVHPLELEDDFGWGFGHKSYVRGHRSGKGVLGRDSTGAA
jgi:hypothetical protein